MLGLIKTIDFVHVRRADESSVQTICPGMIWALEGLAQVAALLLADPGPAMAADIVESPHSPFLLAQNDQTFTHDFLHEIIARLRELALMPHAQPLSGKNTFLFLRKNFR